MALADSRSCITITDLTDHSRTNMWVVEKFLKGKFEIEDRMIRWGAGEVILTHFFGTQQVLLG